MPRDPYTEAFLSHQIGTILGGRALAGAGRHAQAVAYDLGLAMRDGALAKGPNNNAARHAAWLRVQRAKAMATMGQGAAAQAAAQALR